MLWPNTQLEIFFLKKQVTLVLMNVLDMLWVLCACGNNKGRTIYDSPKSWRCGLFRC